MVADGYFVCAYVFGRYCHDDQKSKPFAKSFDCVDQVYIADIYPARETDDLGISGKTLAIRIGEKAEYISGFENLANEIHSNLLEGDVLVVMGAGDIYKLFGYLRFDE